MHLLSKMVIFQLAMLVYSPIKHGDFQASHVSLLGYKENYCVVFPIKSEKTETEVMFVWHLLLNGSWTKEVRVFLSMK